MLSPKLGHCQTRTHFWNGNTTQYRAFPTVCMCQKSCDERDKKRLLIVLQVNANHVQACVLVIVPAIQIIVLPKEEIGLCFWCFILIQPGRWLERKSRGHFQAICMSDYSVEQWKRIISHCNDSNRRLYCAISFNESSWYAFKAFRLAHDRSTNKSLGMPCFFHNIVPQPILLNVPKYNIAWHWSFSFYR